MFIKVVFHQKIKAFKLDFYTQADVCFS